MLGGIGMSELVVIFLILLLLFGAQRLPGIAAGLGGAVHTFKKSLKGGGDDEADSEKKALAAKNEGEAVQKTEPVSEKTSA